MHHFTDKDGFNAIGCQDAWRFTASKPRAKHHAEGAYFTTYGPDEPNLSVKIFVPKDKLAYLFAFADVGDLLLLPGGRGRNGRIFFSKADYVVEAKRQEYKGAAAEFEVARGGRLVIGGDDYVVEGATDLADLDTIVRFMRHAWPGAVFETAPAPGAPPRQLVNLFPVAPCVELYIYRDAASLASWQRDGLTEDNASNVVFITMENDAVVFVFDDRDSATGTLILGDLLSALRENRNVGLLPEAA